MKLRQLSLFLENKPGQMAAPCRLLANAGVNIRTLTLADTENFGILRLITPEWQRAQTLLEEAGYVVKTTEVVAVEVNDRPGCLTELLDRIESSQINVEYMYGFTFGRTNKAALIFRFDKPDEAIEALKAAGLNILAAVEIYEGAE